MGEDKRRCSYNQKVTSDQSRKNRIARNACIEVRSSKPPSTYVKITQKRKGKKKGKTKERVNSSEADKEENLRFLKFGQKRENKQKSNVY